jgi:DNA-directed RNA polymerase specialized sigma24 family protein
MEYVILAEDGTKTKVTRAECLAPAAKSDSPFPQRWFVDEESGLVVRLPRTAEGDKIARDNMRDIWREQKRTKRNIECVGQGTNRCPITCGNCPARENCDSAHKETRGLKCTAKCEFCNLKQSRVVEMDMFSDRDDEEPGFEPADPFDFESVQEEVALLDTLHAALADLTQEDRDLIKAIFWGGKTERQLAPELGLKESKSVNKRKHRILELLRNNEALRSFFE